MGILLANMEPRSFPIATAIVAGIILSAALSGKAFGNLPDIYVVLAVIVSIILIIVGASLYYWERQRFYETIHLR